MRSYLRLDAPALVLGSGTRRRAARSTHLERPLVRISAGRARSWAKFPRAGALLGRERIEGGDPRPGPSAVLRPGQALLRAWRAGSPAPAAARQPSPARACPRVARRRRPRRGG